MGDRSATGGSLGRSLRISLFGAVAVIVTAAFVPLLPATLLPRRAVTPIVGTYIATILWLLRNVVGLNWELRGLGARQLGPVLVASKHQSALETLILQYVLADPAIILMPDAGLGHRTGGATMSAILPAPETTPPITMEQVMAFAAASGDSNPVHFSEDTARAAGLAGPVLQGMIVAERFETFLERMGGYEIAELQVRFVRPVPVGSALTIAVRPIDVSGPRHHLRLLATVEGVLVAIAEAQLEPLSVPAL